MPKRLKKIISLLLSALMLLSFTGVFAFAEADTVPVLTVSAYGDEDSKIDWWKSDVDGCYYLFLPDSADATALTVDFGFSSLTVDGKAVANGEKTSVFSEGSHGVVADGKEYTLIVLESDNLPAVYIETESGSLDAIHADKDYKEKGSFTAYENGVKTYDADLNYIKGRGNSTWLLNKKPYNIKFESKTNLFGLGKAKKFSLIASAAEQSLIRNKITYDLAEDVGLYYSSKSQHVDLYINGVYEGNYLICESVEVGTNRVDITDLEELNEEANPGINIEECALAGTRGKESGYIADSRKWVEIPNDPADISGGYLIEFEMYSRYYAEVSGFVTKIGQPITMKSPEYASKAEIDYISSFYQEFEDAVYSDTGYNSLGKHYTEYIDMDSWAKMYLLQEFSMNLDAARTSFYLFKPQGEDKLYASPAWDFDYSLGRKYSGYRIDNTNPELWATRDDYLTDTRTGLVDKLPELPTVLNTLCGHEDFMAVVKKEWIDTFLKELNDERTASINDLIDSLESSAVMDAIRWNRYKTTDTAENLEYFRMVADGVVTFMTKRTAFLTKGLSDDAVRIYYDANGGSGIMFHEELTLDGQKAVLKDNDFSAPAYNYIFVGWNTEKDGSGTSYSAGDTVTLDGNLTLYAQWQQISGFRAVLRALLELMLMVFSLFLNTIVNTIC
ncbi:MAG: CotH kinase family protein [Acutalibacteraceae bacterium]